MERYEVSLIGTYCGHIDAESEDEARAIAKKEIEDGEGIFLDMERHMYVEVESVTKYK